MASAAALADNEPPAKMQKVIDSTDRLVLDVGGTKIVTTATTLKDHSAYFASLLTDNWSESRDCEDAIFLDRDPVAFGKLLAYMRHGMIKVDDIGIDVMILADFLGVEQLLRAIKIRWYINIGKGPVHSDDDDIAAAFGREHGGILKALSSGLFRYFLSRNEDDAEKDFATLSVIFADADRADWADCRIVVNEVKQGEAGSEIACGGMMGALNGLHALGYVLDDDDIAHRWYGIYTMKFSRRSHSVMHGREASKVFIPSCNERGNESEGNSIQQFVTHIWDVVDRSERFIAPGEFGDNSDPYSESIVSNENAAGGDTAFWLEKHNFVTREKELEDRGVMRQYLKFLSEEGNPTARELAIYSRQTPRKEKTGE